jgi:hypothetical protein
LSVAIVEELELIWVCCRWHATYSTHGWKWHPKHVEQLSDKINSVTCASSWNYIVEYSSFNFEPPDRF